MVQTILVLASFLMPQQDDGNDLLQAVDAQRGGRHWIDQKPDPPKTPEESAACFQLEPGCQLQLVAAEPLVIDPVWIDFDDQGRMFVAEYGDYPIGPDREGADPLSRIVLLEDQDGDGRMDKRTVFADKLQFCHSFMPLMGGILAGAQTEILFLKDTDGDNVANVREVWFDGFTPAHPQMQIGCPRWGFDNWVYLTYAPGNVRCRRPGFESSKAVKMPRQDMRFHPRTMEFEPVSGMGQFGNTVDSRGHRFFSTNRNPIMMEMIPQSVAARNPFHTISRRHTDVGASGENTTVFPLVAMKSNWLSHAGTHTSACGVTAYRGDLWDDDFQNSVFACEPVGHLVTRNVVGPIPGSAALTSQRARPKADFLASTDTWFRPASLRTGPDGALFLADMYRMWVEHPKFLPAEIAARIDWRAGEDKGRVWKIVPEAGTKPQPYQGPTTPDELVEMLKDTSSQRRTTAQRLLVERQRNDITPDVRRILADSTASAYARLHALWTLHGLGTCSDQNVIDALADSSDLVRQAAVKIAAERIKSSPTISQAVLALSTDTNPAVQLQVALALGHSDPAAARDAAVSIAATGANDSWVRQALLSSTAENSGFILSTLVAGNHPPDSLLMTELAAVAGARGNVAEVTEVFNSVAAAAVHGPPTQTAILAGLAKGLPGNRGQLPQRSLAALLASPPEDTGDASAEINRLLSGASSAVIDSSRTGSDRKAAIDLVTMLAPDQLATTMQALLQPDQSAEVQLAAIEATRRTGRTDATDLVFERWDVLAPAVRSSALSLLLARTNTALKLLQAMDAGTFSSAVVDIDQRVLLLRHRDKAIQTLAGKVFGGLVSANRKAVADEYAAALTMKASVERGAAVFEKTCSKCHRIDGKGHQVGPDISDTRNRSRDALLYDILDPNRRVDPQFTDYSIATVDGRVFNGLLVSDVGNTIILRQAEGKEQAVPREQIEEMRSTNRSLMPEGVEKDVTIQQMADLLEFLKMR